MENVIIEGTIGKVIFSNTQGHSIFALKGKNGKEIICQATTPTELLSGVNVTGKGKWVEHPKYGRQIKCEQLLVQEDRSISGMETFLYENIDGIGEVLASRLLDTFGEALADVIETRHEALTEVSGITADKAMRINKIWMQKKDEREAIIPLYDMHLTAKQAKKALEMWGNHAANLLKDNYYLLVDLPGIGFVKADGIARKNGVADTDRHRIMAGLEYVIEEAQGQGHCFLPRAELINRALTLLRVPPVILGEYLEDHIKDTSLTIHQGRVYSGSMFTMERFIERRLRQLAETPALSQLRINVEGMSQGQVAALTLLNQSSLMVITGLPGTGKTTAVGRIVQAVKDAGKLIALCAPTGKAAERLGQATQASGKTIHRLLGYAPASGFPEDPLPHDYVCIDEFSMVDVPLAYALLRCVDPGKTQVIIVGDPNQLPSVGPGQTLRDLLANPAIPRVHLTEIHRQKAECPVISYAHQIYHGDEIPPENAISTVNTTDEWAYTYKQGDQQTMAGIVLDCIKHEQRLFNALPQVLVPFKNRGPLSTVPLNLAIQNLVNPLHFGENDLLGLRVGDVVLHKRNDYNKGVFNGEIGKVVKIDKNAKEDVIQVAYNGRLGLVQVGYSWEEAGADLTLAYALTIHKSQGSEFDAVVVVAHSVHHILLSRELLYTAITRAKKRVYVLTTTSAYAHAVGKKEGEKRWTWLFKGRN